MGFGVFKGTDRQVMKIPPEIEHKVERSSNRGKVRRSIRRAVYELFSSFPDNDEFTKEDMEEMKNGRAPYAPESQRVGRQDKIQIHHKVPRHKHKNKTFANRLANLIGLSPLMHEEGNFLDEEEHYGKYHGKRRKRQKQEKERKRRNSIR